MHMLMKGGLGQGQKVPWGKTEHGYRKRQKHPQMQVAIVFQSWWGRVLHVQSETVQADRAEHVAYRVGIASADGQPDHPDGPGGLDGPSEPDDRESRAVYRAFHVE